MILVQESMGGSTSRYSFRIHSLILILQIICHFLIIGTRFSQLTTWKIRITFNREIINCNGDLFKVIFLIPVILVNLMILQSMKYILYTPLYWLYNTKCAINLDLLITSQFSSNPFQFSSNPSTSKKSKPSSPYQSYSQTSITANHHTEQDKYTI